MKIIVIATLLGIALSTSAFASPSGSAPQVNSATRKALNSNLYINRIASPAEGIAFIDPCVPAGKRAMHL